MSDLLEIEQVRIDKDIAGNTGGADSNNLEHNHSIIRNNHNHQWYDYQAAADDFSYNSSGVPQVLSSAVTANNGIQAGTSNTAKLNQDWYTATAGHDHGGSVGNSLAVTDNKPAYYTLIGLIHR